MQLAHNNRVLAPAVDTVFFMTSVGNGYVSSSLVKEIAPSVATSPRWSRLPAAEALHEAIARR